MQSYHQHSLQSQNSNRIGMGVINITPNSFSDGGLFNHAKLFEAQFEKTLSWAQIIDLGAQSTAPMNASIDALEEFSRFEKLLFPLLQKRPDPKSIISLDTYRPEVFYEVYKVLQYYWPQTQVIFNDVSGKLDEDLINLLSLKENFKYIYCHNLCDQRDHTQSHMDFVQVCEQDVFLQNLVQNLKNAMALLEPLGKDIWLDPCFGFSKSREQNQYLLKNMPNLLSQFPKEMTFVYGISRKSFLRIPKSLDAKDPLNQQHLDQIQATLIYELLKLKPPQSLVFRMHSELPLKSALTLEQILE
jgi:dihydropteroate synthase